MDKCKLTSMHTDMLEVKNVNFLLLVCPQLMPKNPRFIRLITDLNNKMAFHIDSECEFNVHS